MGWQLKLHMDTGFSLDNISLYMSSIQNVRGDTDDKISRTLGYYCNEYVLEINFDRSDHPWSD